MSECRESEVNAAAPRVSLSWSPSSLPVAMVVCYPGGRSVALWNVCPDPWCCEAACILLLSFW